jgi:hypothetical protein
MTPEDRALAERIVAANQLFDAGEFPACYESSRGLLDDVTAASTGYRDAWRAQLLGLIGKSALQMVRLDEALTATRAALQGVRDLNDEGLYSLLYGYRENLLTILAALEPPAIVEDDSQPLAHRTIRRTIIRAQSLTDRFRFDRSTEALEPLREGLGALTVPEAGSRRAEPDDVRVWYLPRVLGLLGFNCFYRGDLARAKALTVEAVDLSRVLDDRMGARVYEANLARMNEESASEQ